MSADDQKIQLVEETANVEKERVVTGRVRVTTSARQLKNSPKQRWMESGRSFARAR